MNIMRKFLYGVIIGLMVSITTYAQITLPRSVHFKKNLLLDSLSADVSFAYSVRKLRKAYAGPAIQVRRSSDDAVKDINFIDNILDEASLLAFVGTDATSQGYISIWYDQSYNGNNAVQVTPSAQAKIVNNGQILKTTTTTPKPKVLYNSSPGQFHGLVTAVLNPNLSLSYVGYSNGAAPRGTGAVGSPTSEGNSLASTAISFNVATTQGSTRPSMPGVTVYGVADYPSALPIIQKLSNLLWTKLSTDNAILMRLNNSAPSSVDVSSGSARVFRISRINENSFKTQEINEIICFSSVLSDRDRDLLYISQKDYFGITP